ncbi:MAG: phosphate ABC transporter permease PstA [Nitrospina sp.]|nr:phosphate ABC transporter permease PstA [Nitrospina sp.]
MKAHIDKAQKIWARGDSFIWLTGATLAGCMIMISGLLLAILVNGVIYFWPSEVYRFELKDDTALFGEITDREEIIKIEKGEPVSYGFRIQVKRGNRDLYGDDFIWVNEDDIKSRSMPETLTVFERREWGNFYGTIQEFRQSGNTLATGHEKAFETFEEQMPRVEEILEEIKEIEKFKIGEINHDISDHKLNIRGLEMEGVKSGPEVDEERAAIAALEKEYEGYVTQLARLRSQLTPSLVVRTGDGRTQEIPLKQIVHAFQPNAFGWIDRCVFFVGGLWEFIWGEPRESNTEGGIFPAIFGTVMMVMIMSIVATPLGVLAAFYLREYATQGKIVSTVRIAVNNLAGVPSIVFGVFGVGFFIYFVGGTIDKIFYPEALPTPTYGTGGILWASLTLSLLTVPVVIVATEEGLAAVPRGIREAALALGATKFETIFKIVLPAVMPSILTGLILAMARAAGEVAPLMITGVVKLAPALPIDSFYPFLHLDRKFMHLGFHIYDVGFQSPNVDAARPMVYTTTFLLLLIVLLLNSLAIALRNRLRKKLTISGL